MARQTYMRPSSYAAAIPAGNYKVPTTGEILRNAQTMGGMVKAYQDQEQQRELGEAMAGIPEAQETERVTGDTEQSAMLAEQTADFADTPGGIPTEAAAQMSAGQTRMTTTTRDWKSWEDSVMEKASKMGPEAVQAAQQYIQQTQQQSFEKDAMEAMRQMSINPAAAARALERAYSNMPDGNSAEVTVGPEGNLMLQLRDEETGEPLGAPEPIDQQDIAEFIEMTQDPVAWSEAVTAGRVASEEATEKKRQWEAEQKVREAAEARLSKTAEGQQKLEEEKRKDKVAQDKVTNELNDQKQRLAELKQQLEGRKYLGEGSKRAAELRKLEGEIKLNEAKAAYYNAGGSQKNEASFFKKKNDLLQRLNTASSAFADADEAMAKHQRRKQANPDYVIPEAAQKAYDREQKKYTMIMDEWDKLDKAELAGGVPTAPADSAIPPVEPVAQAPAAAVELLRQNPTDEMKGFFRQQFGYLPDDI